MELFRITARRWQDTAFDGEGARLAGGRWTSPGRRAVYTSSSTSLAILETLVHTTSQTMPNLVVFRIEVPDHIDRTEVVPEDLPDGWRAVPGPQELTEIGDRWRIDAETALLLVPSALVPIEKNAILNPDHEDFNALSISDPFELPLDRRMLT